MAGNVSAPCDIISILLSEHKSNERTNKQTQQIQNTVVVIVIVTVVASQTYLARG